MPNGCVLSALKGNVGIAAVVGNAAEIYAAGAVEIGGFHLVDGGGAAVCGSVVTGVGCGGIGAVARVLAVLGVRGARCPDSSRATRSASSSVRLGPRFVFSARAAACSSLCGDNSLGAPSSDPCEQRKPQHHGGADGKYLLVGGLARH